MDLQYINNRAFGEGTMVISVIVVLQDHQPFSDKLSPVVVAFSRGPILVNLEILKLDVIAHGPIFTILVGYVFLG